jgi:hypothetical protein
MRVLAIAAFAAVLFASDEAGAACNKGMLWPYVRNPGDCLTDAEVAAGKVGAYNGPVNTAPDVSAIKIEQPPQGQTGSNSKVSEPTNGSNGRGLFDQIGIAGLFGGGSLFGGSEGVTSASAVTTPNGGEGAFSCNKGYFWPFYRSPGDCLTDIEKKNGQKGVYGGGSGITPVSANVVTAAPAGSEVPVPPAATAASSGGASSPPAESAPAPAATCHKGLLWPFVRDPGDCPTDVEKKAGSR